MIREAATLCVLRPEEVGFSVLMVRRAAASAFVGGAYVFPGGAVEEVDRGPLAAAAVSGAPAPEMVPWLAAAFRETAEEAGVLVAVPAPSPALAERLADANGSELYRSLAEAGLAFDAGRIGYLSNWLTPASQPRRFDTRFFAAVVPPGTQARPDGGEITEVVWAHPADALGRAQRGEWPIVFPTLKHLELLAGFSQPEEVVERYRRSIVEQVEPRLTLRDGRLHVLLPGEPGYEEAMA